MANPSWLDDVRKRLLRQELPLVYVQRFMEELTDHLDDLKEQSMEADAISRLGKPDQVAEAAVTAYQRRRFFGGHPAAAFLVFGVSPPVSLFALVAIAAGAMWVFDESGDHAYPGLLGDPLYLQEPVRYLAALGDKPWRPCAWDFQKMWPSQMKLARQVGAGVSVSNGWIQYTGLARLPESIRRGMLVDIDSLV
ncbi:MAG: hypothetical protein ABSG53_29610 [Thermoguttaceae bacterium]|jgi:hypothetical protein